MTPDWLKGGKELYHITDNPQNLKIERLPFSGDVFRVLGGVGEGRYKVPYNPLEEKHKRDKPDIEPGIADLFPKYEVVIWPFFDFKINQDGSTTSEMYWKINGSRISDHEYQKLMVSEMASLYGLERFPFDKNFKKLMQEIQDRKLSSLWLQSALWASDRAILSPERAEFIASCIPLDTLVALGPDDTEAIRVLLTAYDIMRPDARLEAENKLKSIAANYSINAPELDTTFDSWLTIEERFVLAKIRADMPEWSDAHGRTLALFREQVSDRKLQSISKQREEIDPSNFMIRNFIKNILVENIVDVDTLLTEERIKEYRGQYNAMLLEKKNRDAAWE